tara:strand:+ start:451 stop:636 length:186 start_codon:yes stop_codon:yes gene_type:complete
VKNFKWQYCEDDSTNDSIDNSIDYNESMIKDDDYPEDNDLSSEKNNVATWYDYYNEVEIEY